METFTFKHAELLYSRFAVIYGDKFLKSSHDAAFKAIWYKEWADGLAGIDVTVIKKALEDCKSRAEWPPSIAEFRRYCEKASGIPSVEEALAAAIRRDFYHPIILLAHERVGSWAMRNEKSIEVRKKFEKAYQDGLAEFRKNPNVCYLKLPKPDETKKLIALPPVTHEEAASFRERLKHYEEKANAEAVDQESFAFKTWDKTKVTRGHRNFDQTMFEERKNYLLKLSEREASGLSVDDKYDRIRFIRELEANSAIKDSTPRRDMPSPEKTRERSFNGPKLVYKTWMN